MSRKKVQSTMHEDELGTKWVYHGKKHNDHGPARTNDYGLEVWYQHGKIDRADGPALKEGNRLAWFCQGEYHRLDGPAVIYSNEKPNEYWVYGKQVKDDSFLMLVITEREKKLKEI